MKAFTAKKTIAIFTALSLAFLQAVPAGVAANTPVDQPDPTSVSNPGMPVTENPVHQDSEKDPVPPTTTTFQMNTGGIVADDAPDQEAAPSIVEDPATEQDSSEDLTNGEIQAQIDQLLEEARLLEEQAAAQTERASVLEEQANRTRQQAEQMIARAQEQARIAQSLTRQGQSLLLSAEKEMAAVLEREKRAHVELAVYKKMKPSKIVAAKIAQLEAELKSLAKQKDSIARKITNAKTILQDAARRQQLASALMAQGQRRLKEAEQLLKQSDSLLVQAQALRSEAAAKIARANELKTKLIPPSVEQYAKQLQDGLGSGFKVLRPKLQPDGTYLILVRDSKMYTKAPATGLYFMSLAVSKDGVFVGMKDAAYYGGEGNIALDAELSMLLFKAMAVCPEGQQCRREIITPEYALKKMSELSVTKVENGAIFFTHGGKDYMCYREDEAVKVEEIIPPVQAAINDLVSRLGLTPEQAKDVQVVWEGNENYNNGCANRVRPGSLCPTVMLSGTGVRLRLYQNEFHYFEGQIDLTSEVALIAVKDLLAKGKPLASIKIESVILGPARGSDPELKKDIVLLEANEEAWRYTLSAVTGEILKIEQTEIVIADTHFEMVTKADIESVINSSLSGTDRDLALAALNAMPTSAVYYKVTDQAGNVVGYQCELQPLDPNTVQKLWIPQEASVPVSSRTEIYSQGQKTGELKAFVLGPRGPAMTFSMMQPPAQPVQADMVKVYDLQTGRLVSEIHYDPQGNIVSILNYNAEGQPVQKTDYRLIYGENYVAVIEDLEHGIKSEFLYWTDGSTAGLNFIRRTDRSGNFTSGINIRGEHDAVLESASGQTKTVQFSSYAELLQQAFEFEQAQQVILPQEVFQAAQANLPADQLTQLNQAMLDVGPGSQYSMQIGENGSKSWTWTSADGKTTYILHENHDMIPVGINGEMREEIRWSFEARSQVTRQEVEQYGAQLEDPVSRDQFLQALAQTDASTVFTKTVSGNDVSYSWEGARENQPATFVIDVRPGGQLSFSIQQQIQGVDAPSMPASDVQETETTGSPEVNEDGTVRSESEGTLPDDSVPTSQQAAMDLTHAAFTQFEQISDGPRIDAREDADSFGTHPYGSYIRTEDGTLHLTFPGSPKPYDGTSQDPGWVIGSGYATDLIYYTYSTDNGATWSDPVPIIAPFARPDGTQIREQSACMNSIVKVGEYYYIFFESYMPDNWMIGTSVARSKTIGGGYEILTDDGMWTPTVNGQTSKKWKAILTPRLLESEAGLRVAISNIRTSDGMNLLYGAGLPSARVVDGRIVLNYLDTTYDYAADGFNENTWAYHPSMMSRMQVEFAVDGNGNLNQVSPPVNVGEKAPGTVRWEIDQAVYFPEIQQYLMFTVDRNTREIFARASLDGITWGDPKAIGSYPEELMPLWLEHHQGQTEYRVRVLTDESGNGSLNDLRLILGGDYIFENQEGWFAGFGNLYEFRAVLSFNAWDVDQNGVLDNFDRDGDGKSDAWSNRPDGKINMWDINGDGIADAWSNREDSRVNMWDTDADGAPDVFDSDGDGKADWGSASNTFTAAQIAYMAAKGVWNTVDLNNDGVDDRVSR